MSMAGSSVADKAAKESSSIEAGDFGVKLQSSKLLQGPWKMMMMVHHDNHHHRPFPPCAIAYGDADADGPTNNNNNNNNNNRPNIYPVFASCCSDSSGAAAAVASGGAVGVRTLQPFDISPTSTPSTAQTAFKSPGLGGGGGMAASLEFPFTSAQWKELERQAMIYKYMKASVPVPPDLLVPIIGIPSLPLPSSHPHHHSPPLNVRLSGGGRGDVEPGRCRRTDGKKWRCSRDVAPDQKYCERHMHRGRPRSRKPVEVELANKKTRHSHSRHLPSSSSTSTSTTILAKNAAPSHQFAHPFPQSQTPCFLDNKPPEKAATFWPPPSVSASKQPRNSDWIMNEQLITMAAPSDQQWHHLMQIGSTTTTTTTCFSYNKEHLNLNSYASFRATEEEEEDQETTDHGPLFLNSEFIPLGKSPEVAAAARGRGFIDAWSTGVVSTDHHHNANSSSGRAETHVSPSPTGKLSLSSLSLSMGVNNFGDDDEMGPGPIHMGLGVSESEQSPEPEYASKSHLSSWLAPASWAAPSTPGGPLAEVLRPSKNYASAAVAATEGSSKSNPSSSSSITRNASYYSPPPPVTAVSSPSGVLQRTLASLSDSSGSSSPTLASSSGAKPDIGLMWLKEN